MVTKSNFILIVNWKYVLSMVKLGTDVLIVILSPDLCRKEDILGKSLKGKNLEKVYPGTMYFISPGLLIGLARERLFIWLITCINNCRNSSNESYATHYKRIKKDFLVKECIGVIIKTFKRKMLALNISHYTHLDIFLQHELLKMECSSKHFSAYLVMGH